MKAIEKCLANGHSSKNEHIINIVAPMEVKLNKYWGPMKEFAAINLIFDQAPDISPCQGYWQQ
jgi:hypothetical protein